MSKPNNCDFYGINIDILWTQGVSGKILLWERVNTSEINSEMDENQRVATIEDFKNGALSILVAGYLVLDPKLEEIPLVINYDLPLSKEKYIHRAGRTQKLDKKRAVISFVTPMDYKFLQEVEKYYNTEIVECPLDADKIFE